MAYLLVLLNLAGSYFRLGDLYPSLSSDRIMLWLGLAAAAVTLFRLLSPPRPTFRAPQIILMALLILMIAVSPILSQQWFGGAVSAFYNFAPTALMFYLILLTVTSFRKLRLFGGVFVLLLLVVAVQGILAYHYGYRQQEFLLFDYDPNSHLTGEAAKTLKRIRSVGFLNDPNDLAQALLAVLPFLPLAWRRGKTLRNLFLVCAPAGILLYATSLTRSRGGLVSLGLLIFLMLKNRLGRVGSITIATLALAAFLSLNFLGGRALSMDDSAESRIAAWSNGLEMLKSSPLWGVGYGNFTDESGERTAHNSFVLCFAELGLAGYFLWLSLIVISVLELRSLQRLPADDADALGFRRWARAIELSLYTFLAAAWFLSRTYILTLYILLAMAVALVDLARRANKPVFKVQPFQWMGRVAGLEFASIALIYVFMRVQS